MGPEKVGSPNGDTHRDLSVHNVFISYDQHKLTGINWGCVSVYVFTSVELKDAELYSRLSFNC